MKKMTCVVLMLCIAMMCTTPFEAQSQNRRTGGGNSGTATKKENVQTKKEQPQTKMVTPSGQTQRQSRPAGDNTQTTAPKKQNKSSLEDRNAFFEHTTTKAALVQKYYGKELSQPKKEERSRSRAV